MCDCYGCACVIVMLCMCDCYGYQRAPTVYNPLCTSYTTTTFFDAPTPALRTSPCITHPLTLRPPLYYASPYTTHPLTHAPPYITPQFCDRRVVEAFGNCEALAAMYTDDITWRLNHSLAPNIAGPHVGKEATCAFNTAVFTKFYREGTTTVNILDEVGDEASSCVRFNMHAVAKRGYDYDVEYILFAKTRDGKIYEVVEIMDSHASNEQHAGNLVGVPPEVAATKAKL